ncbi:hypothetical protein LJ756_13160 [Arthrobacter sp. zg-Y411]|uniref:hypothetical protein n=1 Tax=Arthrobacter zhangbolii TaxID=2886936 RepID=UPI001D152DC7|nr:hypothetical protein [Arthrobacter zhangbolii]MCC3295569.1 hypothetical protein [Arthrobacter zhangbolii]
MEITMDGPFNARDNKHDKGKAFDGLDRITESVRQASRIVSTHLVDQTSQTKKRIEELNTRTPDAYDEAVAEYNSVFTAMSDKGMSLMRQRERSTDLITLVEMLVNSIANTPKSFRTDVDEILLRKKDFLQAEEFARKDLEAARRSAVGAGAGFTAGAAIASVAPTAAMWAATTFGTASTGTAISTLSGAAATNAALAWLGGGAIAAGGAGSAAGSALLALAGPIGWTIAGATLLTTVVVFSKKKFENRAAKDVALTAIKQNIALTKRSDIQIATALEETSSLRNRLVSLYAECLTFYRADFATLNEADQVRLATLVNNTKACAALLSRRIDPDE